MFTLTPIPQSLNKENSMNKEQEYPYLCGKDPQSREEWNEAICEAWEYGLYLVRYCNDKAELAKLERRFNELLEKGKKYGQVQ